MIHVHNTSLHVSFVYIYLHLLPRTPDCVMAEARITELFGETQTDGRSVRISRGSLGFHGIGVVHAKGSLEVALPPTSWTEFCQRQGHVRRQRQRCATAGPGSSVCYSAVVKVKGINMMKEEFLDGPTMGGRPYGAPSLPQLLATTAATTTPSANHHNLYEVAGALIRRLGLVTALNRRGSPTVGNDPKCRRVNSSPWVGNRP